MPASADGWNYGTEPDEARRIFNGYGETGGNVIDGLAANRLPLGGLFKQAHLLYPAMLGASDKAVIKRFLAQLSSTIQSLGFNRCGLNLVAQTTAREA